MGSGSGRIFRHQGDGPVRRRAVCDMADGRRAVSVAGYRVAVTPPVAGLLRPHAEHAVVRRFADVHEHGWTTELDRRIIS